MLSVRADLLAAPDADPVVIRRRRENGARLRPVLFCVIPAYFKRMSFLTDLTPATLRVTTIAVFSAAVELTNPLS
jgi:hypothetical protein